MMSVTDIHVVLPIRMYMMYWHIPIVMLGSKLLIIIKLLNMSKLLIWEVTWSFPFFSNMKAFTEQNFLCPNFLKHIRS